MKAINTKNVSQKAALLWLVLMIIMAVFAPYLANEVPLYVKPEKKIELAGKFYVDYRQDALRNGNGDYYFAPIPYSSGTIDAANVGLKSPFDKNFYYSSDGERKLLPLRFHHWMGTDEKGADIFAGIIYGCRHSIFIAFFAIVFTTFLALLAGVMAGYFAVEGIQIRTPYFVVMLAGFLLTWFYLYYNTARFTLNTCELLDLLFKTMLAALVIFTFHKLAILFSRHYFTASYLKIPIDAIITRITEAFIAIPKIVIAISLCALFNHSVLSLILIFGIMEWPDFSRIIRAEVIRMKQSGFVEASLALGLSHQQIIIRHILPNLWPVIKPIIIYGIGVVILAESGLSFLGLGVEPGTVTWGNMLAQARQHLDAWWIILFPSSAIMLTMLSLNTLSKSAAPKNL
jgi:peptide/nickel transport system permease protein